MNNCLSLVFWCFTLVLTLAATENDTKINVSENTLDPPSLIQCSDSSKADDRAASATTTFGSFLEKHVFQPNTNILFLKERHHRDYGIEDWNVLLRDRLWNYGTKPVNSVIIGSRSKIANTFRTQIQYIVDGKPRKDTYWSEEKFPMYLFQWNDTSQHYEVFNNCPEMYFVALTDNTTSSLKPIHFVGQQETRIDQELTIPWDSCKEIQSDSTKLSSHTVVFMIVSALFTLNNI